MESKRKKLEEKTESFHLVWKTDRDCGCGSYYFSADKRSCGSTSLSDRAGSCFVFNIKMEKTIKGFGNIPKLFLYNINNKCLKIL